MGWAGLGWLIGGARTHKISTTFTPYSAKTWGVILFFQLFNGDGLD
jgi:hypothetical protein